jgi:hypothetical protein
MPNWNGRDTIIVIRGSRSEASSLVLTLSEMKRIKYDNESNMVSAIVIISKRRAG